MPREKHLVTGSPDGQLSTFAPTYRADRGQVRNGANPEARDCKHGLPLSAESSHWARCITDLLPLFVALGVCVVIYAVTSCFLPKARRTVLGAERHDLRSTVFFSASALYRGGGRVRILADSPAIEFISGLNLRRLRRLSPVRTF
jgi:hypothetical protein